MLLPRTEKPAVLLCKCNLSSTKASRLQTMYEYAQTQMGHKSVRAVTARTALYSEASQQRSYFSILEQVAQASRLQQQLRLFLQDEDNPSLNNSLTSANFNVITQKIGNFFPQFPSSASDCYRPIPQLHFDPSDLCLDHTFILSCYVYLV